MSFKESNFGTDMILAAAWKLRSGDQIIRTPTFIYGCTLCLGKFNSCKIIEEVMCFGIGHVKI